MKPMSETVDIEINNSAESENQEIVDNKQESIKTQSKIESNISDHEIRNSPEENAETPEENFEAATVEKTESNASDEEKCENSETNIIDKNVQEENRQDSVESTKSQSSVDKTERQESLEEKSPLPAWSYSQWSENYESIDDEKPVEDLNGDPTKLILWAAEKNELETMRKLLEEDPTLVNVKDNDLYTPLHRASYGNNVEVIQMLLSYDADIHSQTADGWQALHCACKWDSVEAVSLLLQNGADVNAQTKGHITPLHLAASNANGRRTLELLLWQPHILPNAKNDAGDTAYDIAYRTGPLGALFEILEESVNIY